MPGFAHRVRGGDKLLFDLLHQSYAFGGFLLREQNLSPQRLE